MSTQKWSQGNNFGPKKTTMRNLTWRAMFLYYAKKLQARIKEMQINGKQTEDQGERAGLVKDHEFMF